MSQRVNEHAWDGAWYVAISTPTASRSDRSRNTAGQIYTNGQSWAVLSGFAAAGSRRDRAGVGVPAAEHTQRHQAQRARLQRLRSQARRDEHLSARREGKRRHLPARQSLGDDRRDAARATAIAPSSITTRSIPPAKNDKIDEYECEPYVYAQNILGDEHPQFGLARNSWLSGTASWVYQAATQYILGVQPTYDGLRIDPCIPAAWDGFSVTRRYRGAIYAITVTNPDHHCRGVRTVIVDGQPLAGSVLPVFGDGQTHQVNVVMG